jgi:dTDP-4-amino-4,6-dideoxy-D-galactose acyltransferase
MNSNYKCNQNFIDLLPWDSNFFGFPIAEVVRDTIAKSDLTIINNFCKKNKIKLLQFKCDAFHQASIRLAETNYFHYIDLRMTFVRSFSNEKIVIQENNNSPFKNLSLRKASDSDIPHLKKMIKNMYKLSRYYFDPNFPKNKVSLFYQNWIEKSVRGTFDDMVYILSFNLKIVAFCSISLQTKRIASIGLFGVNSNFYGNGFGTFLLEKVSSLLFDIGIKKIKVVTQGRNIPAQNLYQKSRFRLENIEIYYHRWY